MKKHLALAVLNLALFSFSLNANAAKVFVYCSEGSPSKFSPALVTDGTSFNASSRILYNRLVEFKSGTTEIIPALADKWTVSKDGMTYTFQLRKGVKFHTTPFFKPTRDFNADDVLFTFNRQFQKDHPFHKVGGGNYEYFDSMDMPKLIKDIRKLDDYTVVFTLNQPEAPFISNLAMDFASIYSAEYAGMMMKAGSPDLLDNRPIGTGPFILQEYVKDNSIRYAANADFFRGKSPLDKIVFAITPDASVRLQKLKTGECHLATDPSPADLEAVRKTPNLTLMTQPGLNIAYLAFNVKKPPYDKLEVRQAINYALDRESYVKAIYLGNAQVAKNPLPPTIWSYNNQVKDYSYNPAKAKELLAKAGYANGFEAEIWTMPVSRPYNPNGKKMGEMMQADLAKVGIKAKLISYDWPTYLSRSKSGEHQMLQFGWTGDNGDPDNFLFVNLSCAAVEGAANRAFWCDKTFDDFLIKAKKTSNISERTRLYQQAQVEFKAQAPWVTLAHSIVYRAMSKKVVGYKIDPLGADNFYGVDLK